MQKILLNVDFLKLLLQAADMVFKIQQTKVFLLEGFLCMLQLLCQLLYLVFHQYCIFLRVNALLYGFLFVIYMLGLLLSKLGLKAFDLLVKCFLTLLVKLYRGQ